MPKNRIVRDDFVEGARSSPRPRSLLLRTIRPHRRILGRLLGFPIPRDPVHLLRVRWGTQEVEQTRRHKLSCASRLYWTATELAKSVRELATPNAGRTTRLTASQHTHIAHCGKIESLRESFESNENTISRMPKKPVQRNLGDLDDDHGSSRPGPSDQLIGNGARPKSLPTSRPSSCDEAALAEYPPARRPSLGLSQSEGSPDIVSKRISTFDATEARAVGPPARSIVQPEVLQTEELDDRKPAARPNYGSNAVTLVSDIDKEEVGTAESATSMSDGASQEKPLRFLHTHGSAQSVLILGEARDTQVFNKDDTIYGQTATRVNISGVAPEHILNDYQRSPSSTSLGTEASSEISPDLHRPGAVAVRGISYQSGRSVASTEPLSVGETQQEEPEMLENDIARAVAVDAELADAQADLKVQRLLDEAPRAEVMPPSLQRRKRLVGVGLVVVLLGIAIGVVVGILAGKSRKPTSPTEPQRMVDLRALLEEQFEPIELDTPQYDALKWLALADPLQLTAETSFVILMERYVIVVLYFATNGEVWYDQIGFLGNTSVCEWNNGNVPTIPDEFDDTSSSSYFTAAGVFCDNSDFVTHIALVSIDLRGFIPNELLALESLEYLNLSNNGRLSGPVPALRNPLLSYIDLSYNTLTGMIPTSIGELPNLSVLRLNNNLLQGSIPLFQNSSLALLNLSYNSLNGTIPTSIGQLTSLSLIRLFYNSLTGTIPASIGELPSLISLELEGNILEGSVPEFQNPSLTLLDLSYNNLTGTIPASVGDLTSLTFFNLYDNGLEGPIPSFSGATALSTLWLGDNLLSGNLAEILVPSRLPPNLVVLDMLNNQLSGSIPTGISGLTSLVSVSLGGNRLTGSLPSEIFQLSGLSSLSISSTAIEGTLSPEIQRLSSIQQLDLRNTSLTGTIPTEIGNLTNLYYFDISSTYMGGTIPTEIGNLSNLYSFDISSTDMGGTMPTEIGRLGILGSLYVRDTLLMGTIPTEISLLAQLYVLDISKTRINGTLPTEFGLLSSSYLGTLDISNTEISGTLPTELGVLLTLGFLNVSSTLINGTLPTKIGNLVGLNALDISYTEISGKLPTELGLLSWLYWLNVSSTLINGTLPTEIGNLVGFNTLDISNTGISGTLPTELGLLALLSLLNVSSTLMNGTIPTEIGGLSNIWGLDLGDDEFVGTIPSEIGKLRGATLLNFRQNQLTGLVPTEIASIPALKTLLLDGNDFDGSLDPFFCSRSGPVDVFSADCLDPDTEVECSCCSHCCKSDGTGCEEIV